MKKEKVSAKQLYLVEDNDTKELTTGRKMYNLCMHLLNNIPYSCYFAIVLCVALLSIYPYVAEDRVEEVKSGVWSTAMLSMMGILFGRGIAISVRGYIRGNVL